LHHPYFFPKQQTGAADGLPLVAEPGWSFRLTLVLTVTTITACLIWLSDAISRRGIGWGVSLLFFAGLAVGLPGAVSAMLEQMRAGYIGPAGLAAFVVGLLALSSLVVLVDPARWRNASRSP
jgi:preprotein translocase subunit SecY